jgi:hypothetical protein
MKKEAPATKVKRQHQSITPRCPRLIRALRQGPLSRMDAALMVGTTNAPESVRELRLVYGLSIITKFVAGNDRNGRPTRTGLYHLAPDAKELADSRLSRNTSTTSKK